MSVKERLKKYIEYKRISERQFSLSIGVSAGYVNSISKSIQPDKLSRITAQYPDLNTTWLLTGEGEMLKSDTPKGVESGAGDKELIASQQRTIEMQTETINRQSKIIEMLTGKK